MPKDGIDALNGLLGLFLVLQDGRSAVDVLVVTVLTDATLGLSQSLLSLDLLLKISLCPMRQAEAKASKVSA